MRCSLWALGARINVGNRLTGHRIAGIERFECLHGSNIGSLHRLGFFCGLGLRRRSSGSEIGVGLHGSVGDLLFVGGLSLRYLLRCGCFCGNARIDDRMLGMWIFCCHALFTFISFSRPMNLGRISEPGSAVHDSELVAESSVTLGPLLHAAKECIEPPVLPPIPTAPEPPVHTLC